jgi:hypothetical protein
VTCELSRVVTSGCLLTWFPNPLQCHCPWFLRTAASRLFLLGDHDQLVHCREGRVCYQSELFRQWCAVRVSLYYMQCALDVLQPPARRLVGMASDEAANVAQPTLYYNTAIGRSTSDVPCN